MTATGQGTDGATIQSSSISFWESAKYVTRDGRDDLGDTVDQTTGASTNASVCLEMSPAPATRRSALPVRDRKRPEPSRYSAANDAVFRYPDDRHIRSALGATSASLQR
jgi:hypothetical protein